MSGRRLSLRSGFSWVELLAIVTIMAIVAAIVVPRWVLASDTGKARINQHNKAVVNAAVDRWYVEKGTWPADNLSDISADTAYFPAGVPVNPFDRSTYSLSPTTHHVD